MDRGTRQVTVHGAAKSWTQLSAKQSTESSIDAKNIITVTWRIPDPYLLLESPRLLSPAQGPWTSYQPT